MHLPRRLPAALTACRCMPDKLRVTPVSTAGKTSREWTGRLGGRSGATADRTILRYLCAGVVLETLAIRSHSGPTQWATAHSACPLGLWLTQGRAYRLSRPGDRSAELGNEPRSSPPPSSERDERADPQRDPRFLPRNADSGIDIRTPRRQWRKTGFPASRRREDHHRNLGKGPILSVGKQTDALDPTGTDCCRRPYRRNAPRAA